MYRASTRIHCRFYRICARHFCAQDICDTNTTTYCRSTYNVHDKHQSIVIHTQQLILQLSGFYSTSDVSVANALRANVLRVKVPHANSVMPSISGRGGVGQTYQTGCCPVAAVSVNLSKTSFFTYK